MERSELVFTGDISGTFSSYCKDRAIKQAVIIVDSNTQIHCLRLIDHSFPVIAFPAGELSKNLDTLELILDDLLVYKADRNTVIFNLGGGVVSDMGGFAASIYKRGLRYVNIPTTLLGMVDAAIGGKTGVDFHNYKNYLGTFYLPEAVIISKQFLDTLPKDELENAWAEIIKTAAVGSAELLEMISSDNSLGDIIVAVSTVKQSICEKDPRDQNMRQLLNFGHTIGHAFESYRLSIHDPVMHGMAVAKGMLYETRLAERRGILGSGDAELICHVIKKQTNCKELTETEFNSLMPFLQGDKKNTGGDITFSLPTAIGQGVYGVKIPVKDLKI